MRPLNYEVFHAVSGATSLNGHSIPSQQVVAISMQAVVTGSLMGTFKFQASNDNVYSPNEPTHWSDITDASIEVSSAGTYCIPFTEICYQYVRVVWVRSSGTGNLTTVRIKTVGY